MNMFSALICRLLIMSMALLPFSARAGMIGTDQAVAAGTAQAARDKVRDYVSRAEVQQQMEAFGLTAANARDRVDALTDEEIQRVAGKIGSMPAGASETGTQWVVIAVIAVAILIYYYWK